MLQILNKAYLKPNMSNNDRYKGSIYCKSVQLQIVMKYLIRDFIKKISNLEISHQPVVFININIRK